MVPCMTISILATTLTTGFSRVLAYLGSEMFGDISTAPAEFGDVLASVATRLATGSPDSDIVLSTTAGPEPDATSLAASRDVGETCSAFFSLNLASKPSTRFSSASSTSVFGPRFLGTASMKPTRRQSAMNRIDYEMEQEGESGTDRICRDTGKPGMPRRRV